MNKSYEIALAMIGGALCYNVIMPLLENCGGWLNTKIAASINKTQINMQLDNAEGQAAADIIQPNNNSITQAIGFEMPSTTDEEGDRW